uniref:Beta-1,4-mannosyl-glycoprotein 4-beta-N-acetylglucosaminyltransferase b n=1 Tax=Eptatretus burgeri TaxID=7764 RepID=A0A8C4QLK2_EPTBU
MRRRSLLLLCASGLGLLSLLQLHQALRALVSGRQHRREIFLSGVTPPNHGAPSMVPTSAEPVDLYLRSFHLSDDMNEYYYVTPSGFRCLKEGSQRQPSSSLQSTLTSRGRIYELAGVKGEHCFCRPGWHGPHCSIPTVAQHSNLPSRGDLRLRTSPRRVLNVVNVNHELDLLEARFNELRGTVDVFVVCESNYTAYGEPRTLLFHRALHNGSFAATQGHLLYVFLDHFPAGGRQNGWVADDYLRTYASQQGLARIWGLRPDDLFVINDADELPLREGILFLKLHDGWPEPVGIHLRPSIYGFFWRQPGSLQVLTASTVRTLTEIYNSDGILLRRRHYYDMPGFRDYERRSQKRLAEWALGSSLHLAGWHCSWCFSPEGILHKLISAQNGDFPRWGDYPEKRDLVYIRELVRTGGWFDGTLRDLPMANPSERLYAPRNIPYPLQSWTNQASHH